jgi:signal transduction histidine kinase
MLARSDAEQLEVRRSDVLVADWLHSCCAGFASRAAEAGVTIDIGAEATLTGCFDPDRVRQAVDNVLDNALRFAPRGSTVAVRAERRHGDLVIEVSDKGPGFPSEYLDHAFERFSRSDASRARHSGGAGLGLAIVDAIATAHGGHATARNGDPGAVVTLTLAENGQPPG